MSKRFFVLDQNYFRNEKLASLLDNDSRTRFIIPDVALIEMCKSDSWERTLRQSLTYLARHPTRCFSTIAVSAAVRYEIENRKSVDGNLIYREFTPVLRSLLREIQSGVDGATVERFRAAVDPLRKGRSGTPMKLCISHRQPCRTHALLPTTGSEQGRRIDWYEKRIISWASLMLC